MRTFTFPNDRRQALTHIEESFLSLFAERGYVQIPEESLLPMNDRSVLFTNATITALKPRVLSGEIEAPGVFLVQQCLRVQNSENLERVDYDPPYMSYFRMPGLMAHPDHYADLCVEVWMFLHDVLEIPSQDIVIRTSGQCEKFFQPWYSMKDGPRCEVDTRVPQYYRWTYGMDGIHGVGYTFAVRDSERTFGDFGNIVEVRNDERIVGYEFGVGTETLAARMYKLRSPFEAAPISDALPFSSDPRCKLLQDCIVVSLVLYRLGIRPGTGGARHVLKRIVKGIRSLASRIPEMTREKILLALREFEQIEFHQSTDLPAEILKDIREYDVLEDQRQANFTDFVQNQARLSQSKAVETASVLEKLRNKGKEKYHLSDAFIDETITRFFNV